MYRSYIGVNKRERRYAFPSRNACNAWWLINIINVYIIMRIVLYVHLMVWHVAIENSAMAAAKAVF